MSLTFPFPVINFTTKKMPFLEKQILDHVGFSIKKAGYSPSKEEQKCMDTYDKSPVIIGLGNFVLFGVRPFSCRYCVKV